jgi:hypothetical protein
MARGVASERWIDGRLSQDYSPYSSSFKIIMIIIQYLHSSRYSRGTPFCRVSKKKKKLQRPLSPLRLYPTFPSSNNILVKYDYCMTTRLALVRDWRVRNGTPGQLDTPDLNPSSGHGPIPRTWPGERRTKHIKVQGAPDIR